MSSMKPTEQESTGETAIVDSSGDGDPALDFDKGAVYTWHNLNVYNSKPPAGYVTDMKTANKLDDKRSHGCCAGGGSFSHILKNVDGVIRPGQLLALMGASGAGKTTLLNVLHFNAGKLHVDGDRCINGVPVESSHVTDISAYVQQEDLFIPTLTVREHLIFTARVKMDQKISYGNRIKRVDQVIHDLGLLKCQNTKIGDPSVGNKGISGGEMKRLAFAAEYLTDPAILFCDEPTSGLDAFMAQSVVEVMRTMASHGKSIICTIHQPASEVFEMFDHIYLLSAGRIAFQGSTPEAIEFFDKVGYPCPMNHNPADFFIFTLAIIPGDEENCRARTDKICGAYETSAKKEEIEALTTYRNPDSKYRADGRTKGCGFCGGNYRASWWVQFDALFRRCLISTFRDPMFFFARLTQTIVMSLILGIVFYQQPLNQSGLKNINGALFMFVMVITILNTFGVIFVFCDELPIFLREHWNGMYRTDTYFMAKSVSELPFILIFALIFDAIAYNMVGLIGTVENFMWSYLVLIMVANVSASFGYLMSTVCKNLVVALAITPPLLVPVFLFSGFFLREEVTPWFWKWTKYCSWFFYGCEILFVNQWLSVNDIDNEKNETLFLGDGEQVLMFFGYEYRNFRFDWWGLTFLMILLRVIAYLCLLFKTYQRK